MTKLQHLLRSFCKSQTVKTSIVTILFCAACMPLLAQTVNTVGTGVYYHNGYTATSGETPQGSLLYCNGTWDTNSDTDVGDDRSFIVDGSTNPESNRTQYDPWVSSGLIEYDQPYPSPTAANNYPNHCLGLCASFSCSNLPV
ncbi:MAG: hypothetical protein IKW71_01570, partial [Elusimicrobiaceae bacterium]|nr:hypothetical protein [Elusimicrobiaceae bacterium]